MGRGGSGNVRSPSRDAYHEENRSASTKSFHIRSEQRGHIYDRELILAIDSMVRDMDHH